MHLLAAARDRVSRYPARWTSATAVLCAIVAYGNHFQNPFVYDDFRTIVDNQALERFPDLRAVVLHDSTRPLASISFAIDRAVWGTSPFGFHVTSLLLHLVNVVLVFLVAQRAAIDAAARTDRRDRALETAAVASTLFAVHPALTQAVGYISARADLLCATGCLVTLLFFRRGVLTGGARWHIAALAAWAFAVASKELAVMLPPLLLVYDVLLLRHTGRLRDRLVRLYLPVFAFMGALAAARVLVLVGLERTLHTAVHWQHLLVEADVVRRYVSLIFLATPQSVYHAVPAVTGLSDPRAVFALTWLAALLLLVYRAGIRDPIAVLGVAWFLLMLAPPAVLVLLNVGEPMAEHRLYLPSIGVFLAVGGGVGTLWAHGGRPRHAARPVLAVVVGLLVIFLGERTLARNQVWGDPVRLWSEATARTPDMWWPHQMLGEELQRRGRCAEAVEAFRNASAAASEEPQPYLRAGMCLTILGRLTEAETAFEQGRRVAPASSRPLLGLGTVALLQGRAADAQRYFDEAVAADPDNVELRASIVRLSRSSRE
jgi:protein O-mannosyl-transferase